MPYIYFLVSLTLKNLRFNEQRSLSNAFPSPLPWLKLHANFSQISQKISSDIKEKNKKKNLFEATEEWTTFHSGRRW